MPEPTWDEIARPFAEAVRDYHVDRGHPPDASNVQSSVRINSDLVPSRGDVLIAAFAKLGGVESLAGKEMVDLGSGWGSLTAYFAWRARLRHIVGVDNRPDFLSSARSSLTRSGFDDRVELLESDIRDISLPDDTFDVALANNVLVYLVSLEHLDAALAEVHRVLRPGGCFVVHQANRWKWRDPFTDDPLIHLLRPGLTGQVSRVMGWRDDHERVRLVSVPALRRSLKAAGFTDIRAATPTAHGFASRATTWFGKFFVIAARKPSA